MSKLIILDSDIVVVDDIAKLWKEFDKFSPTDIGAMAVSQDGFYILHGHRTRQIASAAECLNSFDEKGVLEFHRVM